MVNVLDFIRATELYKKFQVDELLFVEFKCPYDDSTSGIWWHNNFFAFILGGSTLLKTPQQELTLQPGDCFFAKKGCVLTLSPAREDFCELLIFVPDDFIRSVIRKYEIPLSKDPQQHQSGTIIPLTTDDVLLTYFQSLLSYFSMAAPPTAALLKLKFEELIVHLASSHYCRSLTSYFDELCLQAKPSIKAIMEANFFSNLPLNDFARLCARSLSAFKREFRALYHTTPGKWLLEKRLEYSRFLLETTGLGVEEVCVESGFENRSHFIRVFKDKYGYTPGRRTAAEKVRQE